MPKHMGASLRSVALLLMGVVLLVPLTANSADPTKALFGCLKSARDELAAPMELPGTPQPARTGVIVLCEGPSAKALFDALELIADQKVDPDRVTRRSDTGITCVRFADSFHQCLIGISVGGLFVDAIK
jgi:hypothetical protein